MPMVTLMTTNATPVDRRFSDERRRCAAFKRKALGRPPMVRPNTVERVAEAQLPTELGEFRIIGYRSLLSKEQFVVDTHLRLGEFAVRAFAARQQVFGDRRNSSACQLSLANFTPVPPSPLFDRKVWILRLRHRCHKHVKATGIDSLPPQTA